MDLQFQLILLWMLKLVGFAEAQIPSACTAVTNKQCCPNDCSGHGTCTDITSYASWGSITGPGETIVEKVNMSAEAYGRQDVRFQWPTVLFTHVCKCYAPYGGPDCSDCDFGYEMKGGQCQRITRVRKNFAILSEAERSDFIKVVNESKNEDPSMSQWAVVVQEPDKDGMNVQYVKTATYDFFVYDHFMSAREVNVDNLDGSSTCPDLCHVDFAHGGPAFLTWHRYYLLLFERELGRIAERLKSDNRITSNWNRYNFGLPYWDWGDSDEDLKSFFSAESFGRFEKSAAADRAVVTGNLFDGNNWPVVCDQHYRFNLDDSTPTISCSQTRNICNPTTDRTATNQLERGKFILRGRMSTVENRSLPIQSTIQHLFSTNLYDYPCENSATYSTGASGSSFRNRVEGYVNLRNESADNKFEKCGSGFNNFHNRVHLYIHGHMRIVPSASNDPVFYLHHNNVDRIFEKWLQKYKNSPYMPTTRTAHPGHNADDYLVPFFPLKTNRDIFKEGTEFGFAYDLMPDAAGKWYMQNTSIMKDLSGMHVNLKSYGYKYEWKPFCTHKMELTYTV